MNNDNSRWLSASAFAALTKISHQKAREALKRCHRGSPWRGTMLRVVIQKGRGGASGFSYLVSTESLPPDIRERAEGMFEGDQDDSAELLTLPGPATGTALAVQNQPPISLPAIAANAAAATREWEWKREIIHPAMILPKGSSERAAMIEALASTAFPTPNGKRKAFGVSTLRTWIALYEEKGLAGLCRKSRSDHGDKRVLVSQAWDEGVSFSDDVKAEIAAQLVKYVKSVWAKVGGGKGRGAAKNGGGWRVCCRLATKELIKLTRAAGLDIPTAQLLSLCEVPRHFVDTEEFRNFALLHTKNNDAKRFFDTAAPRTRRTREGMVPMELVVGDVHHVDIYLRRDDGSNYTPKMIAWCDIATNTVFWDLVFPEKGKGVCQEDIIKSFIAMTQHPEGGMPQALYLDNGSEYFTMDFIEDAMKLSALLHQKDFRIGYVNDEPAVAAAVKRATCARSKMVIKAQPYNAPAKPIEGIFAVLESGPFAMVPGWIGGNRMKAKTKNVGKEPAVFEGTKEEFRDEIFPLLINWYDTNAQGGSLKGRSPRMARADAVNAGWKRTDVEEIALQTVFSTRITREVSQGEFRHKNIYYGAPKLLELLPGTTVTICVPKVGSKSRIPVLDENGNYLCIAEPSQLYGFLDQQGAEDRGRRVAAQNRAIATMAAAVDDLDMMEEIGEAVALHAPAPISASGGMIHLSDEMEAIAQATKQLPATKAQIEDSQYRERLARRATLAKLAEAS